MQHPKNGDLSGFSARRSNLYERRRKALLSVTITARANFSHPHFASHRAAFGGGAANLVTHLHAFPSARTFHCL